MDVTDPLGFFRVASPFQGATFSLFFVFCVLYLLETLARRLGWKSTDEQHPSALFFRWVSPGTLKDLAEISLILIFIVACDQEIILTKSKRLNDIDAFTAFVALFFVASFFTLQQSFKPSQLSISQKSHLGGTSHPPHPAAAAAPPQEKEGALPIASTSTITTMNRPQTEEWKGWMQWAFLLYHFFDTKETYNAIRVLVSAYAFLTGFGNVSFFRSRTDFSAKRVLEMLFRLNFLPTCLLLSMNAPYILYYIVPLHTIYFLVTYFPMVLLSSWNSSHLKLSIKLLALWALIWLVWDFPWPEEWRIFDKVFYPLYPLLRSNGSLHEWHFRSYLDHYSALLGMVFAVNFPFFSSWLGKVEAQPPRVCWSIKILLCSFWIAVGYFYVEHILLLDNRFTYNSFHPYTLVIPLLLYILLRNIIPSSRLKHMELARWFGTITLETYVLQYHVFLSDRARGLLQYLPASWPLSNFLIGSIVLCFLSVRVFHITTRLKSVVCAIDGLQSFVFLWFPWLLAFLLVAAVNFATSNLTLTFLVVVVLVPAISFYSHQQQRHSHQLVLTGEATAEALA